MIRLMLTLAPIACILAAEGFSAILRRFMAYLRYHGEEVNHNGEKKSMCMLVRKIMIPFTFLLQLYHMNDGS